MSRSFARVRFDGAGEAHGWYILNVGPHRFEARHAGQATAAHLAHEINTHHAGKLISARADDGGLWLESDNPLAHWVHVSVNGLGASVEMLS